MIMLRPKWHISLILRHELKAMIGVLIFPDFQLLDVAGPISVFEIANRYRQERHADPRDGGKARDRCAAPRAWRCWRTNSARRARSRPSSSPAAKASRRPRATHASANFVKAVARRGTRVASVCSGTFVLAEAGLLDGKRATTHWQRTRQFLATYPKVKLEPDQIFVRDGQVWSSAGITAGIDLALAMVAEDYGETVVERTARQLVLYHRRSGGQSQFSSLLELKAPTGRFGPLLTWARENLDAKLTVEDLAERAGMSSRHFTRAFIAETGSTPSKAIERLRIEVARARVQSSIGGDRARCRGHGLPRSRADASRLHPRLRPAAAIAAPGGEGRRGTITPRGFRQWRAEIRSGRIGFRDLFSA